MRNRVYKACDRCRQKHWKCDRFNPCSSCNAANIKFDEVLVPELGSPPWNSLMEVYDTEQDKSGGGNMLLAEAETSCNGFLDGFHSSQQGPSSSSFLMPASGNEFREDFLGTPNEIMDDTRQPNSCLSLRMSGERSYFACDSRKSGKFGGFMGGRRVGIPVVITEGWCSRLQIREMREISPQKRPPYN
ncbi:hypothetical protein K469DRAFT_693966 [Zopfia rhizophila CBS 207.26]|uniref:Zn(2)-C6 fungal-type domain-containing protein n=1 Tax=Zopfia rhizophila CBS 207.26 TaxID=1314779 RepID=A0A6A6DMI3_9PEZI|nr:hypothetical protein K469DRAFT_693966 [Zopfia rhizophila CBS 207.26]